MKLKKLGSTENKKGKHNFQYIGKGMGTNMTNRLQKQGCLMQKRQLKITGQEFQVKIYKRRR